jgi:transmembrane sensor
VRTQRDELSVALEGLRNRPVVTESRAYARRWERSSARAASLRRSVFGPAGALLVVGIVACFGYVELSASNSAKNVVATHVGETRAVALDDGTRIVLDTGSRAKVNFSATARDVELLEGQAHFEVAHDVHRPFRVHTNTVEVVAVGTAFDVAALPSRTTVTLIEGRVNVRAISSTAAGGSRVEMLTPGQQWGVDSAGQLLGEKEVKIANVTAWQRGNIVIDDAPLADALGIMNRYSNTHIVVRDPALQQRHVSGAFRIGDVATEAVVLERYFGLKEISHSKDEIVLERE